MKDKYDELEATVDKLEDLVVSTPPRVLDYEIDGYVEGADLVRHKAKRDIILAGTRLKLTGKNIFTFNFVRHFIIGAGIAGGAVFKAAGWSAVTLITAVAGGLVSGIRKSWSDAGVSVGVKKGDISRVWKELLELIVAIIDYFINKKRKEAQR